MKIPFKLFLILIITSLMFSCNSKKIERLEDEKTRMQTDSIIRDSLLNDWFASFNEIEENLAEISGRQKLISVAASSENPGNLDVRERIRMEINAIHEKMMENDDRIEQLKKQLKSSNIKIQALEETVAILTQRIEEKDAEIFALREELIKLNIEIESLDEMIAQLEEETEVQESIIKEKEQIIDEKNEVWYIIGTNKYLKDNGIIEKTGFLGSADKLSGKVETGLFTTADMRELASIEINSERAELVTVHPENSFEFVQEGKVMLELKILDPEEFWKTSKYCVVKTK